MKRLITLTMALAILATAASASFAQGRSRRITSCEPTRTSRANINRANTNYDSRGYYDNSQAYDNSRAYDNRAYGNTAYYDYRGGSVWDRHRDKLTVAVGTAGGAAIGGLIGGQKGAVIGAISGAAGSALYTYKIRSRGYRY